MVVLFREGPGGEEDLVATFNLNLSSGNFFVLCQSFYFHLAHAIWINTFQPAMITEVQIHSWLYFYSFVEVVSADMEY